MTERDYTNIDIITLEFHRQWISIYNTGGRICAPWHFGRLYESPLLEYIYSLGLKGTAVDVGAGIGNHTLWFAGICGFAVVSFEPRVYSYLHKNILINEGMDKRVVVHKKALGAKREEREILGQVFPVYPLDCFEIDDVAVIKIDVEDMEADVLIGAKETIDQFHPLICAEEWGPKQHDEIAAILEPLGYTMGIRFSSPPTGTPMGVWRMWR